MIVGYLYVMRVALAGGVALAALAPLALSRDSPASALLRGTFHLDFMDVVLVVLFAFVAAMACAMSSEVLLRYGSVRFGLPALPAALQRRTRFGSGVGFTVASWLNAAFYGACALAVVAGVLWQRDTRGARIVPVLLGTLVFAGVLTAVFRIWRSSSSARARLLGRLVLWTPEGYVGGAGPEPELLPGHGLLTAATVATLAVYAGFGVSKWFALLCEATPDRWYCAFYSPSATELVADARAVVLPEIPTLACILVLIALVVLVVAGLAFLLDRFRIPLLVPMVGLAMWGQDWPQADNYFDAIPRAAASETAAIGPAIRGTAVVQASFGASRLNGPPPITGGRVLASFAGDRAIVVAASGGGIHAAAWAAAVLARLEQTLGSSFHESVALLSAVSGGSIATMYFADSIHRQAFNRESAHGEIFVRATASSLDDIAWALVYPDLIRLVLPFAVTRDRGSAAEHAWSRLAPSVRAPLSTWRRSVAAGAMPAVIFNGTVSDTGSRFVVGSTDLVTKRGLVNFLDLYPQYDIPIVTAARLSASFTYVSPAARIDEPVARSRAYHIVDGGYYDNFGVSSVVDWLKDALAAGGRLPSRLLVVQIRGAVAAEDAGATPGRGIFYQVAAPLRTLLGFRDAAQIAHNTTELSLLCRALSAKGVSLENAVFQYPDEDTARSWHLTPDEVDAVWKAYEAPAVRSSHELATAFVTGTANSAATCAQFDEAPIEVR
jgi:predicted acylesterase/phospholipase RssA